MAVWAGLEDWLRQKGYPPTVRELAAELGINRTAVNECLKRLAELGAVERTKGVARGVKLVKQRLPLDARKRLPTEEEWRRLGSWVSDLDEL
jgi:DNA-binding FadR family transcriptional regulator